jgi:diguanylate cyclase (GGDEF)-like protein/PAS domain S-box-containing protein
MSYTILLIDDSAEDRETYRRYLSKNTRNEYRAIGVDTIEEGLQLYHSENPDLILLDYRLPDGTAMDFIEEVVKDHDERALPRTDRPIVILTGQGDERIAVKLMKAGASDYLVKDTLNEALLDRTARSAIERHELLRRIDREREERRLIADLAVKIHNSLDIGDILRATVEEARKAIGADRVMIYRFNPDDSRSIVAESAGETWRECSSALKNDTTYGDRYNGKTTRASAIEAIADVELAGYSDDYLAFLRRFQIRAQALLPIPIGTGNDTGTLWGALAVHQCERTRRWRESEIECLRQLSVQLGIAIRQARLYDESRRANEFLEETVSRRTEELLRAREQLNLIIEGSGDGVWYLDIATDSLYLSTRYLETLGYEGDGENWTLERWSRLLHPEERDDFERSHREYLERGRGIHEFEYRLRGKNGEYKYFHARGKAIRDASGRAIAMAGSATDITERKRLEERLKNTNALLNNIFDNNPVGMNLVDSSGRFIRINETLAKINGFSVEEHRGRTMDELIPDIAPRLLPLFRQILETGEAIDGIEIVGETPARPEETRYWSASYFPVELPDGERAIASMVTEITDLQRARYALIESEEKFRRIAETIGDIFWVASAGHEEILYVSPAFETITGYTAGELYANPLLWREIIAPEDRGRVEPQLPVLAERGIFDAEYRFVRADGKTRWMHDRGFPVRNRDGEVDRIIGIASDITDRKLLEDNLYQEKELAQITLKSIDDCVITTDAEGRVTYLNPVAEKLIGLKNTLGRGRRASDIFQLVDETTRQPRPNPIASVLAKRIAIRDDGGTLLIAPDGRERAITHSAAPILDRSGQLRGTVLVLNDVTEARAMTRQLQTRADRDALTGLFNRFYFERELERAKAEIDGDPEIEHILCYLDLDHFKVVNDTRGHAAGDELLRQLSALMKTRIRSTDTLARIGGDEFALLLYHCPLAKAIALAEGIVEAVRDFQFVRDGRVFRIGVSIGLVPFNASRASLEQLLGAADVACYAAKQAGRGRVHVYHEKDERSNQTHRERQWVLEVRSAIGENRFCLYHQAIAPTDTARAGSSFYEILLRLVRPDGSIVSPMAFLPAMERYGLMPEVDRAVIELLFRHLENNDDPGAKRYMINLSGATLSDAGFLDFLVGEIEARGIRPGSLGFEITETVAISNFTTARRFIDRLRECGCHFALDDFGSGMSSFSYLKNLPVDYLKIDGYFVRDILDDPLDAEIVSAIGKIAARMEIRTIAEFVENDAIRERLLDIGIDYVQGYGVAPVLPLDRPAPAPELLL